MIIIIDTRHLMHLKHLGEMAHRTWTESDEARKFRNDPTKYIKESANETLDCLDEGIDIALKGAKKGGNIIKDFFSRL